MGTGPIFMLPLLLFQPMSPYLTTPFARQLYFPIAYPQNYTVTNNSVIELAQSYPVPSIPGWSVVVYLAVSSFIFVWCVGGMFLGLLVTTPPTSNFDVVDFASRVIANHCDGSFTGPLAGLSNGKDSAIREALEDKLMFVRNVGTNGESEEGPDQVGKIGFTMNGKEGHKLAPGELYA